MLEFESENSRVDLLNSVGLTIVFGFYGLGEIENSENLTISISSICVLEFCKAIVLQTLFSLYLYN